jgi:hypothetical protein
MVNRNFLEKVRNELFDAFYTGIFCIWKTVILRATCAGGFFWDVRSHRADFKNRIFCLKTKLSAAFKMFTDHLFLNIDILTPSYIPQPAGFSLEGLNPVLTGRRTACLVLFPRTVSGLRCSEYPDFLG